MSDFFVRGIFIAVLMATGAAASAAGSAASDKPADFSHILPLATGASQAVVQLRIPRDVYLLARSAELNDLRVFDAAGASMPFALADLAPQAGVDRPAVPVAIFAVHGPAADAGRMHDSLQIRTGTDGAVISVTAPSRTASDELVSLVLDLRSATRAARVGAKAPVGALALTLPAGTGSYSAWVALDVSDDLQSWEELAEAAVSWLVNEQGATVQKHRIEFAPRPFRYARLRWLDGKPIAFSAIHAEYVVEQQVAREMDTILLQGVPGTGERDLVYTAPIAIPVRSVGFAFKGQNVVMPVLVGQYQAARRRDPKAQAAAPQLHSLVNTTFYQMTQDGRRRVSGDAEIPLTHASHWVVRPLNDIQERPELRLRWTPASIVFVAGGTAPYKLAFGHAVARPASVALHQVAPGFSVGELAALEAAKPGELVRQQAPGQATADPASGAGNKRGWLWALLVGGVAALGTMAWQLFRQLKRPSDQSLGS